MGQHSPVTTSRSKPLGGKQALVLIVAAAMLLAAIPVGARAQPCHMTRAEWQAEVDRLNGLLQENSYHFQTTVAGRSRGISYSGYAGVAPPPGPGWAEAVLNAENHNMNFKSDPERVGVTPRTPSRQSIRADLAEARAYYNRCLREEEPEDESDDEAEETEDEAFDDVAGGAWAELSIPISSGGDTEHVAWTCDGTTWQVRHITEMLEGAYGSARFTMPPKPANGPWKSAPFPYDYGFDGTIVLDDEADVFEWHFKIKDAVAEVVDGDTPSLQIHYSYEWTHVAWDGPYEMPGHSGIAGPVPLFLGSYEECP